MPRTCKWPLTESGGGGEGGYKHSALNALAGEQKALTYCGEHHPADLQFDAVQKKWVVVDALSLLPAPMWPMWNLRTDLLTLKKVPGPGRLRGCCQWRMSSFEGVETILYYGNIAGNALD